MDEIEEKKDIEQQTEGVTNPEEIVTEHTNVSPVPVLPQLSVALGLLVFVFGVTYIGATDVLTQKEPEPDVYVETLPSVRPQEILSLSDIFEDTTIEAKSAIVWDVANQKVLFNKNADIAYPLASITKLMTALVSYELLDQKKNISITQSALRIEGDSGFVDGEEFTVQDLLDITLIASSNDGASALGAEAGRAVLLDTKNPEAVFVKAMNVKADELGLSKTSFANSTGLDISEKEAGAYGSARDVALLMEYIITNITDAVELTKLDVATIHNSDGAYHIAKNTNEYVTDIAGLIASKTGYTQLSGGNLVVAVNVGLNRPIIVTVLGSSYEGRFSDTLELIQRVRLYVENESEQN